MTCGFVRSSSVADVQISADPGQFVGQTYARRLFQESSRCSFGGCAGTLHDMVQLCDPAWMSDLRARLTEIDELQDGWDGPGSVAPNAKTIEEACLVATLVQCGTCPLPFISAGHDGEIELAWVGQGIRAEAEVSGSGVAVAFLRRPGFSDIERSVELDNGHPDLRFLAAAITQLDLA